MKTFDNKCRECGDIRLTIAQQDELVALFEQKLNIHSVMQAEASALAEGAAVGNSAAGKGVSGGIISCPNCGQGWDLTKNNACSCGAQLRGELLR